MAKKRSKKQTADDTTNNIMPVAEFTNNDVIDSPLDFVEPDTEEISPEVIPETAQSNSTPVPARTSSISSIKGFWSKKAAPVITEPALVFEGGVYAFERLPATDIPRSTLWRYNNSWVHLLERCRDGYKTISLEMLDSDNNIPPNKLYRALHWNEVEILFKTDSNLLQKINTGLMVTLVGILGFLLFLIFITAIE